MGFILSIIAYILFSIVAILNFIVVMYKNATIKSFFKVMNLYWYNEGFEVDKFANHQFECFWNTTMRKSNGYKFGDLEETISSALGKNQLNKTLSWFGWFIVIVLYAIDYKYWRKGGHCINSIQLKNK